MNIKFWNQPNHWNAPLRATAAALGVGAAALLQPASASACGGFFCSNTAPVNQTAEKIVFAQNADDTVTAIIQIQYQGPSEKFAWVLPVNGIPKVGVSSTSALNTLQRQTDPEYRLERTVEGECDYPEYTDDGGGGGGDDIAPPPSEGAGVVVLDSGNVGPYEYVVIQPDDELADASAVAIEWFVENGYDVSDIGPDVLRPYLAAGMNLIAFRLTKGNDAGSIRPVLLTYEGTAPSIPLRPTAVAAANDMGIQVWVLGAERAYAENYRAIELNHKLVNWLAWQANYDDVISAAADEAGGQGFVTERSGSTDPFIDLFWGASSDASWEAFNSMQFSSGFEMMDAANDYFRNWEGWREAIEAATTLPDGVTIEEFGRNPDDYRDDPALAIDMELFRQRLTDWVINPVLDTQLVFDEHSYFTRLYTTMSPEEMIVDPVFGFNPDLPEVSGVHEARQVIFCNPDVYVTQAPWTITFDDDTTLSGVGRTWPIEVGDAPAASSILEVPSSGEPVVMIDNTEDIDEVLESLPGPELSPPEADEPPVDDLPDEALDDPEMQTDEADAVSGNDMTGVDADDEDATQSQESPAVAAEELDAPDTDAEEVGPGVGVNDEKTSDRSSDGEDAESQIEEAEGAPAKASGGGCSLNPRRSAGHGAWGALFAALAMVGAARRRRRYAS